MHNTFNRALQLLTINTTNNCNIYLKVSDISATTEHSPLGVTAIVTATATTPSRQFSVRKK